MRSRETLTLVVVALALFGYVLLFERHQPDAADRAASARRLFPELDPERVTAVSIQSTNGLVRAERVETGWQLANPTHPAQPLLVENWLRSVAELSRGAHLDATDLLAQPGGLTALGLEPPRASVTIEQGVRRFQFQLGQRTPLGNKAYLRIVGEDGVEVTGSSPLTNLPASTVAWRDPAFARLAGLRIDWIQMRAAAREFQVRWNGTNRAWQLERPRPARADSARIEQMLQQLQDVQIAEFTTDFAAADPEMYGLQTPAVVLQFGRGTNALLSFEFGRSPTNAPDLVFARRSGYAGVVLVPKSAADIVALPYTDLLDYRLVDRPLELLERVDLQLRDGAGFSLVRQTNGGWRVAAPVPQPADPALVGAFLDRLRSLRAIEVAKEVVAEADLPSYGLAPPVRAYTLAWAGTGTNPGPALRLDLGTNQAERVFARRSDENPVYAVPLQDCVLLPAAGFQLRDRRIWSFETNEVQSITITHHGVPRKLLRSPGAVWTFAPGSQGMVNTFALEEAVHRLGQLRAGYWEAVGEGTEFLERYGVPQVGHQLVIELVQAGKAVTRRIDFGATSRSGGPYAVVTLETGPTVFELPLDVFQPYNEVVRSMDLPKPTQP